MALLTTSTLSKNENTQIATSFSTSKQVLLSCIMGNALEWYDFVIYGYFVVTFGTLFFPNAEPMTQILASWGIFWSGFLARPLGSIFFGHIGDKISRKYALMLSIFIMAIPTTLIGLLPTYQQIGIIAPLLLILLRTAQGFAIGGEYTGTMVFLVEHAPSARRGLWGSWASFSSVVGVIVGSCLVAGLSICLSSDAIQTWAWRIPFIISILGSMVGIYIRMHLSDPQIYLDVKQRKTKEFIPVKDLLNSHKIKIGLVILLDFLTAVGFFIVAIFLATYFSTYLKFAEHEALAIHTINMGILAIATLFGGWLSDKVGRKPVLAIPCIGFILFSYPLFVLLQSGSLIILILVQAIMSIMFGIFFGAIPVALAEIMPTNVRYSGLSIGHNLCMAIIGGGAPFLASHLIHSSNNLSSPSYLLIIASSVSLFSLFFIKDRYRSAILN